MRNASDLPSYFFRRHTYWGPRVRSWPAMALIGSTIPGTLGSPGHGDTSTSGLSLDSETVLQGPAGEMPMGFTAVGNDMNAVLDQSLDITGPLSDVRRRRSLALAQWMMIMGINDAW
ncbi:hypothetical protein NDU88_009042 [Pleurodeles waltl]|uniref:Uncharacterized protein n=1 Tax=Pleurodeles waltl TaxID=8319 RepID=A0AAV7QUL2_PLEWA|nr:hypothetical protein NDU88_009042 [Pleurodeles waltl]